MFNRFDRRLSRARPRPVDDRERVRHGARMRWERLIEEIGAQLEQEERDERDAEIADRIRREVAQVELLERLRAVEGEQVSVSVAPDRIHRGELRQVGAGWLLIAAPPGECLIALAHLQTVVGLGRRTASPLQAPARRMFVGMDLRYALRGVAADRAPVRIGLSGGGELTGTIDRVGRDFIDVALHAIGEPRRSQSVTGSTTVALSALAEVARLPY